MKKLKEEIVDYGERLKIVDEMKTLIKENGYNNDFIKDFKKEISNKTVKREEVLINYISESDLKVLKTEFPDK